MRNLFLALVAITAATTIQGAPADAREGPFCLIGPNISANSRGDCSYSSYAQCQATASGLRAYCDRNYYYGYGPIDDGYDPAYSPRRRARR